jgi:endonuclease YncB( thermonuclease family)
MTTASQFIYRGTVVRVVDGDTVVMDLVRDIPVNIDLGFKLYVDSIPLRTQQNLRVLGVNAPEIHGVPDLTPGQNSKAALAQVLAMGPITVETVHPDKYGTRYDAKITVQGPEGPIDVGKWLVEHGFAVPFMV